MPRERRIFSGSEKMAIQRKRLMQAPDRKEIELGVVPESVGPTDAVPCLAKEAVGGEFVFVSRIVRYYHDGQNVVAEYVVGGGQAEALARSYVNGSQYIDERVVMRDYVTVAGNAHPRDFYYLHQELYSEAGLAAANGSLAEAYVYDTYGQARIYQWPTGDFDRDGDVDSGENSDQSTLTSNYASPVTTPWYDLDADGDADSADLAVMVETSAPTELAYSTVGNPYLFTGRLTDTYHANSPTDTAHYRRMQDNRNRIYDAKHGRWMQRDPLGVRPDDRRKIVDTQAKHIDMVKLLPNAVNDTQGMGRAQVKAEVGWPGVLMGIVQPANQYADGMNLYAYGTSRPTILFDPDGRQAMPFNTNGLFSSGSCCCRQGEELKAAMEIGWWDAWTCRNNFKKEGNDMVDAAKLFLSNENEVNAFLHCYGSCITTLDIGATQAKKCTDIHEACVYYGDADETMDQVNNSVGRDLGSRSGATRDSCFAGCVSAVKSGTAQNAPGGTPPNNPYSSNACRSQQRRR